MDMQSNNSVVSKVVVLLLMMTITTFSFAQDDLLAELEGEDVPERENAFATFKCTQVVNGQSVAMVAPKSLQFMISHRFGALNGGAYELWGLDQSAIRMGFDYGINPWLNASFGRSSYQKTYDGHLKLQLLRQYTGDGSFPVSVVWVSGMAINTQHWDDPSRVNYFSSRLSYFHQLLVARKMNSKLSLQVSPTLVHLNLVPEKTDYNNQLALGLGGRYKLGNRLSVNAEYFLRAPTLVSSTFHSQHYNSFSTGIDLETGGHIFQIFLTNSLPMITKGFVTETTDRWTNGGVHIGFNITREF